MKNESSTDERIIFARRQIQSDACQILVCALLLSVVVQQFILHSPFQQFAVEFFSVIGYGIYIAVRHFLCGIDIWQSEQSNHKGVLKNIFFTSIFSAVLFAFLSGERSLINLLLYFACFLCVSLLCHSLVRSLNRKKQTALNAKLDQEEQDD